MNSPEHSLNLLEECFCTNLQGTFREGTLNLLREGFYTNLQGTVGEVSLNVLCLLCREQRIARLNIYTPVNTLEGTENSVV